MTTDNLVDTLRTHPFVEGFQPENIQKLAGMAGVVQFEKNATVFREGDQSSFFYLLLSGEVVLEVASASRLLRVQTVGKGQALGWSSLLASTPKQLPAPKTTSFSGVVNPSHKASRFRLSLTQITLWAQRQATFSVSVRMARIRPFVVSSLSP